MKAIYGNSEELASALADLDGPLSRWVDRDLDVYRAHTGRDGTCEGFRTNIAKLVNNNPKKVGGLLLDAVAMLMPDPEIRGRT